MILVFSIFTIVFGKKSYFSITGELMNKTRYNTYKCSFTVTHPTISRILLMMLFTRYNLENKKKYLTRAYQYRYVYTFGALFTQFRILLNSSKQMFVQNVTFKSRFRYELERERANITSSSLWRSFINYTTFQNISHFYMQERHTSLLEIFQHILTWLFLNWSNKNFNI